MRHAHVASRRRFARGLRILRRLGDRFADDMLHAVRVTRRSPGFALAVVTVLALGIGAATAVFSVVDAVLLQPLPYPDPERLFVVWSGSPTNVGTRNSSEPDFVDYRRRTGAFEDFAALASYPLDLIDGGDPERLLAATASAAFLPLLGVRMELGRHFTAEEDTDGGPDAVILSHGLWQRRFAADPAIIGRRVNLSGIDRTVVGVLPEDLQLRLPRTFQVTPPFDLWIPLQASTDGAPRGSRYLLVIGRLASGVPVEAAAAEAGRLTSFLRAQYAEHAAGETQIRLVPLKHDLVGDVRPVVLALFGAVGFVLLIAIANATNLLLARQSGLRAEIAVRAALGAGRLRLLLQLATQSLLLAGTGAAVGVALAAAAMKWFLLQLPGHLPRTAEPGINLSVVGFALGASLLAALLTAGLAGADLRSGSLRNALRGTSVVESHRLQGAIITTEIASSVVLLVGAGLLLQSLLALTSVRPGFDVEDLLTFDLGLPEATYPGAAEVRLFYEQVEARLAAMPGIEGVGFTAPVPLKRSGMRISLSPPGARDDPARTLRADLRPVTPGYFAAIGTRLLAGRGFASRDRADTRPVAIIDRSLADRIWPDGSAVGRELEIESVRSFRPFAVGAQSVEIVGVVETGRLTDITEDVRGQVYRPHAQLSHPFLSAVVRTRQGLELVPAIRRQVEALDADLPLADVAMMRSYVGNAIAPTRFVTLMFGGFGVVAVVLSCAGVYGVLSYLVSRRRRELGVRMALGSSRAGIVRLILGDGLRPMSVGLLLGIVGSVAMGRYLTSYLYEVEALDATTLAAAIAAAVAMTIAAGAIPALRAARTDPGVALSRN